MGQFEIEQVLKQNPAGFIYSDLIKELAKTNATLTAYQLRSMKRDGRIISKDEKRNGRLAVRYMWNWKKEAN